MTILWAGTEAEAFSDLGGASGSTSAASSSVDLDFSRSYLNLTGTSTRCNKQDFGAIPEAWFHYRWGGYLVGSETSARSLVVFYTAAGQGILRLYQNGSAPNKTLDYWDGSTWVTIGTAQTIATVNGTTIDIQCKIDSVDGRFALYVDGALISELTGDTDFFSAGIDYVRIQNWGNTNERRVSECLIATTSTLGMRVATLVPDGNGANTAWTGDYTAVDEAVINDSDMITSSTALEDESFTLSNLSSTAADLAPLAVIVSSRARNALTGPQNIKPLVRTGGTNFVGSDFVGLNTSFQNGFQGVWELNPDTTAAWTPSDINALEVGAQSET